MRFRGLLWAICWAVAVAGCLLAAAAAEEAPSFPPEPELFEELTYRFIGPVGNRVPAVVGVPGDPGIYYAGAASGGIFKTRDGGVSWAPIFDDQPVASIGSLAVAPADPNVVWAGTGEAFIRSNVSIGNGIYRSTDGGKSWEHKGLEKTGRIARIVVHPRDPQVVFAAALGHCYGPQQERGIYRTTDGGESWERVLFVDEETGASDLVMDPNNPRILFAGMWQMEMATWGRTSGGPGSGLYMSRDGGTSWKQLAGEGLPDPPWGKVALAMTAADSQRVYALIETSSNRDFAAVDEHPGVLWRSDDGGESWQLASGDHRLVQRPLYYSRAAVSPDDPDEIRFMSVDHSLSIDGGKTVTEVRSGWDHHDIWIDPLDPRRIILGYDGGVSISTNRGKTWLRPQLPIAQMYHVATDDRVPYFVYGNRQDGPSFRGPSNTLTFGPIPLGAWRSVGGCESGFAIPEPGGEVVWSGCYDGILERHEVASGHSRNVMVWPDAIESSAASAMKYRFQWTFPLALSPHQPGKVYAGSQHVHQTVDGGQSWQVISPDLTTGEPFLQVRSGGLTADDASPTVAPVVFALAESPLTPGEIWAGTNDGQVQVSRDGGGSWTNLTAKLPDLPPWGTVSNLEPSRHAPGTVYLTVDRHQEGDFRPHVYRSTDGGEQWTQIVAGIPESTHSYAHVVREDPARPGLLYLGTENALYVSFDDGGRWQPLQSNLPPAPVHWIDIPPHFGDLVVATYGRGFWILDDLSPLREISPQVLAAEVHLFTPRPAYRFLAKEPAVDHPGDPAAGKNPDYGASLHYYLAAEAEELTVEILDGEGAVVRTLEKPPKEAGLHRLSWNLGYEQAKEPKLRTRPLEHGHETLPADKGWRDLAEGGRVGLRAAPGAYTLRLTVGEQVLTQPLEVRQDPSSRSSLEDIQAQNQLLLSLRELQDRAVAMINEIEWMRSQLGDLRRRLEDGEEKADGEPRNEAVAEGGKKEILDAAEALDQALRGVEGELFDLRMTSAGQDFLRWPRKLHGRLPYLAGFVANDDFPPTDSQRELAGQLAAAVEAVQARFAAAKEGAVADFNRLLVEKGVGHIVAQEALP